VRYTLPTPTRAPLTTASNPAALGPPFGRFGPLGGDTGTGAELLTVTPRDHGASVTRLYRYGTKKA
jgi:hypothetical protein